MRAHHFKAVLFVFAAIGLALAGCSDDKGSLCKQDDMLPCIEHQYGTCVETEDCVENNCWPVAVCECDASAYYKTAGITCAPMEHSCQPACEDDADCEIGGVDMEYVCEGGRCTGGPVLCETDGECYAQFAGWTVDCTDGGNECNAMSMVCINIGDDEVPVGKCASESPCTAPMVEHTMPAIDGSGDLTVCGMPDTDDAYCDGGCMNPCNSDGDCGGGTPTCDTESGTCICETDADCSAATGASVCSGGACVCGSDADCSELGNADVCIEGSCICSSATVCTGAQPFDGTTWVCEE